MSIGPSNQARHSIAKRITFFPINGLLDHHSKDITNDNVQCLRSECHISSAACFGRGGSCPEGASDSLRATGLHGRDRDLHWVAGVCS